VLRCVDCNPGDTFLCGPCDLSMHSPSRSHRRCTLVLATRGYAPIACEPQRWRLSTCTSCKASLRDEASMDPQINFSVKLQTGCAGIVDVTVTPSLCLTCSDVVGTTASEYGCLPGGSDMWFTNDLLDRDRDYYVGSNYATSFLTSSAALKRSNDVRGVPSEGSRMRKGSFCRAIRCMQIIYVFPQIYKLTYYYYSCVASFAQS